MPHDLTLVALFRDRAEAERAITKLLGVGIPSEQIGYLEPVDVGEERNAAKGAAEGIAVGATSGAIIGEILAAAAIGLVPGVGPAVVAGALLPALLGGPLAGAASGAVVGGLVGTDLGSEEEPYFMQEVKAGRVLVSVQVGSEDRGAVAALRDSGALEVDSLGTANLHARLRRPTAP